MQQTFGSVVYNFEDRWDICQNIVYRIDSFIAILLLRRQLWSLFTATKENIRSFIPCQLLHQKDFQHTLGHIQNIYVVKFETVFQSKIMAKYLPVCSGAPKVGWGITIAGPLSENNRMPT